MLKLNKLLVAFACVLAVLVLAVASFPTEASALASHSISSPTFLASSPALAGTLLITVRATGGHHSSGDTSRDIDKIAVDMVHTLQLLGHHVDVATLEYGGISPDGATFTPSTDRPAENLLERAGPSALPVVGTVPEATAFPVEKSEDASAPEAPPAESAASDAAPDAAPPTA